MAEGYYVLGSMKGIAAHPQKAVLKPASFKVTLELASDLSR
jgi:hypothetical protein